MKKIFSKTIAQTAKQSLIDEVETTPKPGLVDNNNNGSHKDMTKETFLLSAEILEPYFEKLVIHGEKSAHLPENDILREARHIGVEAENAMFCATNGINTHKGAIFSLGLCCVAIGRLHALCEKMTCDNISKTVAEITKGICSCDYLTAEGKTHGDRVYKIYGEKGPRGEAESGFETVREVSMPFLKECFKKNYTKNEALVRTLLKIMSVLNDTNILNRGGQEGSLFVKENSDRLINADLCEIYGFDKLMIEKNLSPGGCADILAVTWFMYMSELLDTHQQL